MIITVTSSELDLVTQINGGNSMLTGSQGGCRIASHALFKQDRTAEIDTIGLELHQARGDGQARNVSVHMGCQGQRFTIDALGGRTGHGGVGRGGLHRFGQLFGRTEAEIGIVAQVTGRNRVVSRDQRTGSERGHAVDQEDWVAGIHPIYHELDRSSGGNYASHGRADGCDEGDGLTVDGIGHRSGHRGVGGLRVDRLTEQA